MGVRAEPFGASWGAQRPDKLGVGLVAREPQGHPWNHEGLPPLKPAGLREGEGGVDKAGSHPALMTKRPLSSTHSPPPPPTPVSGWERKKSLFSKW